MTMKTKKFSSVTVILLVFAAVLLFYVFSYFRPAQQELALMEADLTLAKRQVEIYSKYISDPSGIQAEIDALQAEIDTLHDEGYVNESNVGLAINEAIQRYRIQLSSISLGTHTTVGGNLALPINMNISGTYDDIMDFISHFENHSEGSYLVHGVSMSISGSNCTVAMTLYLCTPGV